MDSGIRGVPSCEELLVEWGSSYPCAIDILYRMLFSESPFAVVKLGARGFRQHHTAQPTE